MPAIPTSFTTTPGWGGERQPCQAPPALWTLCSTAPFLLTATNCADPSGIPVIAALAIPVEPLGDDQPLPLQVPLAARASSKREPAVTAVVVNDHDLTRLGVVAGGVSVSVVVYVPGWA